MLSYSFDGEVMCVDAAASRDGVGAGWEDEAIDEAAMLARTVGRPIEVQIDGESYGRIWPKEVM